MKDVLKGFEWNQTDFNAFSEFKESFLQILAFDPEGTPKLIGTAFIIGTIDNKAVAVTAAHNFYEGVKKVQNPNPKHHPSTPPEFLPKTGEIQVDPKKLRAIFCYENQAELCEIEFATWKKTTDFAYFVFTPQNPHNSERFMKELKIQNVEPKVAEIVALLGFRYMATSPLESEKGRSQFTAKSQLICRVGKVKKVYKKGHLLCRGPCLETSIPVFGGMSGGPVFLLPEAGEPIVAFGLISSDPEALDEVKDNRAIAGSSLISLLSPIFPEGEENLNKLVFDMKNASWVSKKNLQ